MRNRLFNLLALTSLLLCLAFSALWLRSYWFLDEFATEFAVGDRLGSDLPGGFSKAWLRRPIGLIQGDLGRSLRGEGH